MQGIQTGLQRCSGAHASILRPRRRFIQHQPILTTRESVTSQKTLFSHWHTSLRPKLFSIVRLELQCVNTVVLVLDNCLWTSSWQRDSAWREQMLDLPGDLCSHYPFQDTVWHRRWCSSLGISLTLCSCPWFIYSSGSTSLVFESVRCICPFLGVQCRGYYVSHLSLCGQALVNMRPETSMKSNAPSNQTLELPPNGHHFSCCEQVGRRYKQWWRSLPLPACSWQGSGELLWHQRCLTATCQINYNPPFCSFPRSCLQLLVV